MIYLWYIATFVISEVRHQTIQVIYYVFLLNEIRRVTENIKYGLPDFWEQGFTGKTKTLPLIKHIG